MNIEYENETRLKDIHKILTDITDLVIEDETKLIEGWDLGEEIDKIVKKVRKGIEDDLVTPFKKTFNDAVNTVKTEVTKIIAETKKTLEGFIDDLKKGFDEAVEKIKNWFTDIGKKITSGFDEVRKFFEKVGDRFKQMGDGLGQLFTGIGTEVTELGDGLRLGFTNIGVLLKWVGEFIFSYITCGVSYIQNLHRCIFFYVIDTVAHLSYVPVRIFMWGISGITKRNDLYDAEKMIWDKIYEADGVIYYYFGFHIAHYPKNVRDLCYNCKRMRVTALKNKVQEINYVFDKVIPQKLQKGISDIQKGGDKFKGAFM